VSHSVTLPTGEQITSDMSPLERHNAVAKSIGAPVVEKPTANLFGVTGLTDHTFAELARRDATSKPAPAKPAAQAPDPNALEKFDAEMRAAGKQIMPQAPNAAAPDGKFTVAEPDQAALTKLNAIWRSMTPEQRDGSRKTFESDLKSIFEGRRLGETIPQFRARTAPAPAAPAPAADAPAQVPSEPADYIPLAQIKAADCSGYVLPKLVEGQTYHKSVYADVANAAAAGFTQVQIDAYIKQQMKRDGFIK
jgi:hypothetical protein